MFVLCLSRLVWLWGGGDRWHHNNSSPGHLSPRRLTHNGSSPLRYDPLTPIRHWQRDAQLPPLQGCLSPAGTGGVTADSWVGRCERPPIPNELQLFSASASKSAKTNGVIWLTEKAQRAALEQMSTAQRAHIIIAAVADSRKSFWGLLPSRSRVHLQEEDFLEGKKKKRA